MLPLSSTSSLTFFIVELRLRSCEEEAKEDRWPGIRWMLHGWMILIRVLTLFSARNKPHLGCASSSSTRRDFFNFPAKLLLSYVSCYGVMELWSYGVLVCYMSCPPGPPDWTGVIISGSMSRCHDVTERSGGACLCFVK